jgi:hypothetical protein
MKGYWQHGAQTCDCRVVNFATDSKRGYYGREGECWKCMMGLASETRYAGEDDGRYGFRFYKIVTV